MDNQYVGMKLYSAHDKLREARGAVKVRDESIAATFAASGIGMAYYGYRGEKPDGLVKNHVETMSAIVDTIDNAPLDRIGFPHDGSRKDFLDAVEEAKDSIQKAEREI